MVFKKLVKFAPNTKFCAACGPYRALGSSPEYIEKEFDTYKEALDYVYEMTIAEDGRSVFVRGEDPENVRWLEGTGYLEVVSEDENGYYILAEDNKPYPEVDYWGKGDN